MLLGINRRHAAVMAFVEQTVRRDDAIEVLKWRPACGGRVLPQTLGDIANNVLFERRWHAVRVTADIGAWRLHPLWNVGRFITRRGSLLRAHRVDGHGASDARADEQRSMLKKSPPRLRRLFLPRSVFCHYFLPRNCRTCLVGSFCGVRRRSQHRSG